jgi:hypothetical protein
MDNIKTLDDFWEMVQQNIRDENTKKKKLKIRSQIRRGVKGSLQTDTLDGKVSKVGNRAEE